MSETMTKAEEVYRNNEVMVLRAEAFGVVLHIELSVIHADEPFFVMPIFSKRAYGVAIINRRGVIVGEETRRRGGRY